jgi:hypothetical protein
MSAPSFPSEATLVALMQKCLDTQIPAVPSSNVVENAYKDVNTAVGTLLSSVNDTTKRSSWNYVDSGVKQFLKLNAYNAINNASGIRALRVFITESDGTTIYDSSKETKNTFDNYLKKAINENHNSRVAIYECLTNTGGIEFETKFSTSTQKNQIYIARRVGLDKRNSIGCIRISYDI